MLYLLSHICFPHREVIVLPVWLLLNVRSQEHFFSQNLILHRCFQVSADKFKTSHFMQGKTYAGCHFKVLYYPPSN